MVLIVGHAHAQVMQVSPVHGWLLGAAAPAKTVSTTCILFNQFSDGSSLRFALKDGAVETITVMYRTNPFDPERSTTYKTVLEISTAYREVLDGVAYSHNTLTVTPSDGQRLYDELKRSPRLNISAPKIQKTFNLLDISTSLSSTPKCTLGVQKEPAPSAPVETDVVKEVRIYADLSASNRNVVGVQTTWRAQKGERISDIVERWSRQAGQNAQWQSSQDKVISSDFVYQGSYDDALERLFKFFR